MFKDICVIRIYGIFILSLSSLILITSFNLSPFVSYYPYAWYYVMCRLLSLRLYVYILPPNYLQLTAYSQYSAPFDASRLPSAGLQRLAVLLMRIALLDCLNLLS